MKKSNDIVYKIKNIASAEDSKRQENINMACGYIRKDSIIRMNHSNLILGSPLVMEYLFDEENPKANIYYILCGEIQEISHARDESLVITTDDTIYTFEEISRPSDGNHPMNL